MSLLTAMLVMLAFAATYAAVAAMLEARASQLAAALWGRAGQAGGTSPAVNSRAFNLA